MGFVALDRRSSFKVLCWALLIVYLACVDDAVGGSADVKGSSGPNKTYDVSIDDIHGKGVEAYLDNNWDGCVNYFETAWEEYRKLKKANIKCRMECRAKIKNVPPFLPIDIENLHFFESIVRKTLCLLRCKRQVFTEKFTYISPALEKMYENLKPYEYLQLCFYQQKLPQKAASAAFTFLVHNKNNALMVKNLKFYTDMPEVNTKEIKNLEEKRFEQLYLDGADAYEEEDCARAIPLFEESLGEWLKSSEECRAYCESPFDHGWLPDFTSSIANHFTFCLRCKYNCEDKLNSIKGEHYNDILPQHYHYLQFCYFKVGDLVKACQAADSYLLFFPHDKTMLHNKKFYLKTLDKEEVIVAPREEAKQYMHRKQYESMLLKYIDSEFKRIEKKPLEEPQDFEISAEEMSVWNDNFFQKSYMIEGNVGK